MSKLTYLQIVQRVLSMTDGDEVTTLDETVEAEQIAQLVQKVYNELLTEFPWYHKRSTIQLEVTPTANLMRLPGGTEQLLSDVIYYDDNPVYWVRPEVMRDKLRRRDKTLANIDSAGAYNDRDPQYWSSYDDENIIFDGYDGSLVQALTAVWAATFPTAPIDSTDIPDLPHDLHTVLLNGVLEEAFRTQKGDETAARTYQNKYRKGIARAKRWAQRVNKENNPGANVDFGRRNGNVGRNEIPTSFIVEGS